MGKLFFTFLFPFALCAAEPISPPAPTPALLFESFIMGDRLLSLDKRPWSLVCGSLVNAKGNYFHITDQTVPPLTKIEEDTPIPNIPFALDLSPYVGQYMVFYRIDGQHDTFGYFALVTPGNDFYKTPLETMRFSAEYDSSLWPTAVKKISFHYEGQHMGTLKPNTPDVNGRRSIHEAFPNPVDHYVNPDLITYTLHYVEEGKSEGHKLNPSNRKADYLVKLEEATPSTPVPHATRFVFNFTSGTNDINISYRTGLSPKAVSTSPSAAINHHPIIGTAEHDIEILPPLSNSINESYIYDKQEAQISPNYQSYLSLARNYLVAAAQKHKRPVHMPAALRMLRTQGHLKSSVYIGLILMDLQQELGLPQSQLYFPYKSADSH